MKALAFSRLHGCAGLSESLLVCFVISAEIGDIVLYWHFSSYHSAGQSSN